MGYEGSKFSSEMNSQRSITDSKKQALDNLLSEFDHSFKADSQLGTSLSALSQLSNSSSQASSLQVPAKQIIGFYTSLNAKLLNLISNIAKETIEGSEETTNCNQDMNEFAGKLQSVVKLFVV